METTETKDHQSGPTAQSIKVATATKQTLEALKVHHRETYDDVLRRLIEIAQKFAANQEVK
jgi:hypothetical protein